MHMMMPGSDFIMRNDLYDLFNKLDSITYNHSIRVMGIAREIEDFFDLKSRTISNAALIHDIGKVFVSSKILDKVGSLNEIEKTMVNLHPYIGYKILKQYGIDEDICRLVLYHHGLRPITLSEIEEVQNEDVYDQALILHSIDAFEALTSDRPYHRGYLAKEALDIMLREKNHHQAVLDYLIYVTDADKDYCNSAVFRGYIGAEYDIVESVIGIMLNGGKCA